MRLFGTTGITWANRRLVRFRKQQEFFDQLKGCEFWIWNPHLHALKFLLTLGKCYLNHMIREPEKWGRATPIVLREGYYNESTSAPASVRQKIEFRYNEICSCLSSILSQGF